MAIISLSSQRLVSFIFLNIFVFFIVFGSRIASADQPPEARTAWDTNVGLNPRAAGRRLMQLYPIPNEGDKCNAGKKNICDGIQINNGTQMLYCCKGSCSDVLADRNNCGSCGNRCSFGLLCCQGQCTTVSYDVQNCGGCGNVCQQGLRCEFGSCGYA